MMVVQQLSLSKGASRLVDGIDLEIQPGEVVAVIGPNGAGKSSLLKLIAGEWKPTSGSIALDGRPLAEHSPEGLARRRAVLPQSQRVPFDFKALDLVLLGCPAGLRLSDARLAHLAAQAMRETGTAHLADRTATTLSGGELQRVGLARVLLQLDAAPVSPQFLLLDEPTASLDLEHQHVVLGLVRQRAIRPEHSLGAFVILHDLNLASQYADRLILLDRGRMAAAGSPHEVLQAHLLERVFRTPLLVTSHPRRSVPSVLAW
jgi:iron complex transport system ATP-binding protein